ncbi:DUF4328 domain-containing protein [Streptomyces sp. Ag109_G2-15]|uniref:DUF4328 domain-containing protein n=1 Tax=Streptomyces sp. Ag109_G2-15 TaxID=1938850 RepID=UPI000BD0E827|nr:DUF4328 domain-containing protein [Streptomyces sp. Ag109_G2-15]SOD84270.1 protein of unknown function [Streptomyces sp. Ag109_G2-15]
MSVPRLRSPLGLGRATVVLLGLVALTDLLAIGAGFGVYRVADDLARGSGAFGAALTGRAHHADTLYTASGVAQTAMWLVCAVVFLVWLYRVRVNAEVFRPDGHSKARAWVIAGWVVPLANFWYPRRVVLDVWDASGPAGARPRHGLVNLWWALWLVTSQVGWLMQRAYGSAHTAADFREAALEVMISDAVDIVAAGLAVLVVLRLTRMQHQKALAGPMLVPALG